MMPSRRLGRLLPAIIATVVLTPAAASALPGDPPIEALAPADGARLPAAAITVSFACPTYRQDSYGDPNDPITSRGDASDYDVRFATTPTLDETGRLRDGEVGSGRVADNGDGTCAGTLDPNGAPKDPTRVGGRIYWQASRSCVGCTPQAEGGPVRSFTAIAKITGSLVLPRRLYAGYLGVFTLKSRAELNGADVELQRRVGSRWRTLDSQSFRTDDTELVVKLPAGSQKLRAVVRTEVGSTTVATRSLRVRRAGRRGTSRRDDGRYAVRKAPKSSTLAFTVDRKGARLRGFKASVTTFCIGPTSADNRIAISFARLGSVKVAPDGSVVALLRTKGKRSRELLTGRLRRGRFVGRIDVQLSVCSGARSFTAVRR